MSLSLILSMATFALVASISPGPVNIMGLSCGTRYPFSKGLIFVTGATSGFIILFMAVGFGLNTLLDIFPYFEKWLTGAGILFLLYLSYQLAIDNGKLDVDLAVTAPSFGTGFLMQWLNPKAWIASAASIGAYTQNSELAQVALFATIYLPICWVSLTSWVALGAFLRHKVEKPKTMRFINRTLALLLASSCLYLLFSG